MIEYTADEPISSHELITFTEMIKSKEYIDDGKKQQQEHHNGWKLYDY